MQHRAMMRYPIWMNIALYQVIWLLAVIGREPLEPLLMGLIMLHVFMCQEKRVEILLMCAVAALGVGVDSALAVSGFYQFDSVPAWLPLPIWLVAIWLAFAGTLRNGLSYFVARPALAICAAAVGAPLSYLAAGRLGAVSFSLPALQSAMILGAVWAVLMGVFIAMTRAVADFSASDRKTQSSTPW